MNKEQFEETYEECCQSVHAYLKSKLRDRTAVQDLVQDTFVRFFKSSFNSWNDKTYRDRYILLIAKNCWRSYIKNFINNPVRNYTLASDLILSKKKCLSTDYKIFFKDSIDLDIREDNNFDFLEVFYNENALSLLFNDYLSAHDREEKYDRALIEKMINIIYCLPEKQKQAILMVYVNDIKVKDAAAILKTSPNCVSFSLFKAKENIRKKLTNVQNLLCK
jgi:RNA polymerase sigma factor (sigma-70 family)